MYFYAYVVYISRVSRRVVFQYFRLDGVKKICRQSETAHYSGSSISPSPRPFVYHLELGLTCAPRRETWTVHK